MAVVVIAGALGVLRACSDYGSSGDETTPDASIDASVADAANDAVVDALSEDAASADATHPYVAAVLADEPIAYFRVEETSGAVAHDLVSGKGAGFFGTIELAQPGVLDGSLALGIANSGGIEILEGYDFSGIHPYSIEVWFRADSYPNTYAFLANGFLLTDAGRTNTALWVDLVSETAAAERYVANDAAFAAGALPDAGSFHHAVSTYDGTMLRFYVDGVFVSEVADSRPFPDGGGRFYFGAAGPDNASITGVIDELAVYDKALAASRVLAHYDAAK